MSLEPFLYAVVTVFLAELGDKTMLATIFLSAQYRRPGLVLLAAMLALTASTIIAIIIGIVLASSLPLSLIFYLAGFLFLIMGVYTLVTSKQTEEVDDVNPTTFGGMFSLVFLAELGDKTQIAALALAAQSEAPLLILLGALLGFLLVNGVGATMGDKIAARTSVIWIKRITGLFFLAFGILSIFGIIN